MILPELSRFGASRRLVRVVAGAVVAGLMVLPLGCGGGGGAAREADGGGVRTQLTERDRQMLAQYDPASAITRAEIRADVHWLADDEREGRGLPAYGLDEAAEYLAARFARLGLEPLWDGDGYFQNFTIPFGQDLDESATTLAADDAGEMQRERDFNPLSWSRPGMFEGNLVFAGYGMSSDRYEWDDYAEIDVEGKVVLVFRYEPHDEDGNSRFTGGQASREASLFNKARQAQEAGAAAVLVVNPPIHREDEQDLMPFGQGRTRAQIPVMSVSREAAGRLLEAAGLPSLEELQREIDGEGEPASRETDFVVRGGFLAEQRQVEVRNVAGLLRGEIEDEYIIVGAHYDHVGRGAYGSRHGYGEIHNGADDNASGTAMMLALAEAFALAGTPRRSIVFMGFTAEEIGLIGSRHFVQNPPFEAEQMVAMVNLDMVGRLRDDRLLVGGKDFAEAFRPILDEAAANSPIELQDMGTSMAGRSDHASFNSAGIPALFFFTGMHPEYHSPSDTPDTINYDGMVKVARLVYHVTDALAREDRERLEFVRPTPREMMRQEGEGERRGRRRAEGEEE